MRDKSDISYPCDNLSGMGFRLYRHLFVIALYVQLVYMLVIID